MTSRTSMKSTASVTADEAADCNGIESPTMTNGSRTAMEAAYDENVRPALDIIDQLRRVGIEKDIEIPQIAGKRA